MGCHQSRACGAMDVHPSRTPTRHSLGSGKQDNIPVRDLSFVSGSSSATLINNPALSTKKLPPVPGKPTSLCERCSAIDFGMILRSPKRPDISRSLMARRLGEVDHGSPCTLCQFFYAIRRHWVYIDTLAPNPGETFHIRRYIIARHGSSGSRQLFAVDEMKGRSLSDEVDLTTSTKIDNPWWFLPEPSPLELMNLWQCPDPTPDLKALPLVPSSVNYPLLRAWINECESHSSCGRHVRGKPKELRKAPVTRAIDCKTRTIVDLLPGDRYLALSYVWGLRPESNDSQVKGIRTRLELGGARALLDQTSRLLRASVGSKIWVLPTNVPKVIEDALAVVEGIGERYLWVDQYCIDQLDAKDKHNQIRNMDNIYERAYATIVAFSGRDSSCGLPGVGGTPRPEQPQFHSPDATLLAFKAGLTDRIVKSSVWMSRGWTFQEALLSRRLLFFTDDQVYFICAEGAWLESVTPSPRFYNFSETYSDNLPLSKAHTIMKSLAPLRRDPGSSQYGVSITLGDLFEYIQQYSMRRLSFEADALDAFRGLLSRSSIHTYWGLPVHAPQLNEGHRSSGTTGTSEGHLYQGRNISALFLTSLFFELVEGAAVGNLPLRSGEGPRARE